MKRDAGTDVVLGIIAGLTADSIGAGADDATGSELQLAAVWEDGETEFLSMGQTVAARLPVYGATEQPLAIVAHSGKYCGRLGIVIGETNKNWYCRFAPQYDVDPDGDVRTASSSRDRGVVKKALVREHYAIGHFEEGGHDRARDVLSTVFDEIQLQAIKSEHPERSIEIETLFGRSIVAGHAEAFLGAPCTTWLKNGRGGAKRHALGKQWGTGYEGRVQGHHADGAGRRAFEVLYDDGDTLVLTGPELAADLDWERWRSTVAPAATGPPARTAPERTSPLARRRGESLASARRRQLDEESLRLPAIPGAQPAGPPTRSMAPGTKASAVARVLEGMDARTTEAYKRAHPPAERTLENARAFHARRIGTLAPRTRTTKLRWPMRTAEETDELLDLADQFSTLKASTLATYRSSRTGYEQFCAQSAPRADGSPSAMAPYPLLARHVGGWLIARWGKGLMSNLNNTKPLISALTYHTTTVTGHDANVHPFPGMPKRERRKLHRICLGLSELEDMAMKRSVPLTLLLLRLFIEDGAVDLGDGQPNGGLTAQQKRNIRDVARYGLNRVAMLRKDDCSPDKQTVGHYQELGQRHEGRLMVDPGKAHSTHVFAEVPGAAELAGDWTDWLVPGYAMARWLSVYRDMAGGDLDPQAPLFPEIDDSGSLGTRGESIQSLMAAVKGWARAVRLPAEFVERLTPHGFRSGGCSDAINSGVSHEEIRLQGRWTSHAYEMYIHLNSAAVRASFARVLKHAATCAADRDANARVGYERFERWYKDAITEASSSGHSSD